MSLSTSTDSSATAQARGRAEAGAWIIEVSGMWRLRAVRRPGTAAALTFSPGASITRVVVDGSRLGTWDSSLALFVESVRAEAAGRGLACDFRNLPPSLCGLLETMGASEARAAAVPRPARMHYTTRLGLRTTDMVRGWKQMLEFLGECVLGVFEALIRPWAFRWGDCIEQMRRCGAAALPIVGLISALIGVILAFVAAEQLREFGADIYVVDLVGLAVVREMGPMMAAIVLCGRTGAAFAAELGNMILGEEVDALETFGVRARNFLVAPRLIALVLMMPLLAIYADFLGVIGGALIAWMSLDIPPSTFLAELQTAITVGSIATGLLKSFFFGWIVAFSGCFRGMRAERSAVGVGDAATGAVVMGILLVIVCDSIFTVIFNALKW